MARPTTAPSRTAAGATVGRRGGRLAGQEERGLDALADDRDEREDGQRGRGAVVERAVDRRVELAADAAPPGGASRTASRSRPTAATIMVSRFEELLVRLLEAADRLRTGRSRGRR